MHIYWKPVWPLVVAARFLEYPVNLDTWLFLKPSYPVLVYCFKMGYSGLGPTITKKE